MSQLPTIPPKPSEKLKKRVSDLGIGEVGQALASMAALIGLKPYNTNLISKIDSDPHKTVRRLLRFQRLMNNNLDGLAKYVKMVQPNETSRVTLRALYRQYSAERKRIIEALRLARDRCARYDAYQQPSLVSSPSSNRGAKIFPHPSALGQGEAKQ